MKRKSCLILAVFMVIGLCMFSGCGKKDFSAMAWGKVVKMAEKGNVDAEIELGKVNLKKDNFNEAVFWFSRAAAQGSAEAKFNLGSCYVKGFLFPEKAEKLWTEAAEDGYGPAQLGLGIRYYECGDFEKAVHWLKPAAEKSGLPKAMIYLGSCYFYGEGLDMNYKAAYKLWKKAADNGDADSLKVIKYYDFDKIIKLQKKADKKNKEAITELVEYFDSLDDYKAYDYWNSKVSEQE